MIKKPFFSVVIPVYNRAKMIHLTLDSVLSQTFTDYEIIVVDDWSKDEIQEVIARYPNIIFLSQKNSGQWVARNTGILNASWEYICFLDSDDRWEEHFLEHLFFTIKNSDTTRYGVFYGQAKYVQQYDNSSYFFYNVVKNYEWNILTKLLHSNFLVLSATCVKKSILVEGCLFSESQIYRWSVEDYDLWLRLSKITQFKYIWLNIDGNAYAIYVLHETNDSKNITRSLKGLIDLKKEVYNTFPLLIFDKLILLISLTKLYLCSYMYKYLYIWK